VTHPVVIIFALIGIGLCIWAIIGLGHERKRAERGPAKAAIEKPSPHDDLDAFVQWHRDRPWQPIVFKLEGLERAENSFAFRAHGEHKGRTFGFHLRFTLESGRFARCEWRRTGEDSDALIDVLADSAERPRENCRFGDCVIARALILEGVPARAPFRALARLHARVFFDQAKLRPVILMDFDFVAKTGQIGEVDFSHRWALVGAFMPLDPIRAKRAARAASAAATAGNAG